MEMLLQKTDVMISAGGNGECKLLFSVSLKSTTHQVENKYYPQRLVKIFFFKNKRSINKQLQSNKTETKYLALNTASQLHSISGWSWLATEVSVKQSTTNHALTVTPVPGSHKNRELPCFRSSAQGQTKRSESRWNWKTVCHFWFALWLFCLLHANRTCAFIIRPGPN